MKIVCAIKPVPYLYFFVNSINECFKVSLVIIEQENSSTKKIKSSIFNMFRSQLSHWMPTSVKTLVKQGLGSSPFSKTPDKCDCGDLYKRYFGNKFNALQDSIPIFHTTNVNSDEVAQRLVAEAPDIFLDHGTSLLSDRIIDSSNLALNLHWGLSPYYRGTHCTSWAIINWDPYNIGVTIHRLTKAIDGGDIVAQARANVTASDTVHSIDMQLTYLGTELVQRILGNLRKGQELKFYRQDTTGSLLYLNRQWTEYLSKQIEYIETKGLISEMLKKPSRSLIMPIISLEQDPQPFQNGFLVDSYESGFC
jgi:folate-dependent phosphoribosylglycinamide formyltransferase PurN